MSFLNSIDTERTGDRLTMHHMFNLGAVVKNIHTGELIDKIDIIFNMPSDRVWDIETKNWVLQKQNMMKVFHSKNLFIYFLICLI